MSSGIFSWVITLEYALTDRAPESNLTQEWWMLAAETRTIGPQTIQLGSIGILSCSIVSSQDQLAECKHVSLEFADFRGGRARRV